VICDTKIASSTNGLIWNLADPWAWPSRSYPPSFRSFFSPLFCLCLVFMKMMLLMFLLFVSKDLFWQFLEYPNDLRSPTCCNSCSGHVRMMLSVVSACCSPFHWFDHGPSTSPVLAWMIVSVPRLPLGLMLSFRPMLPLDSRHVTSSK